MTTECNLIEAAVAAFEQADYKTAFYLLFPLAMEGNAIAQAYIHHLHESNLGIPEDYECRRPWQEIGGADEDDSPSLDSIFGALDYETYLFFEGVEDEEGDASNHLDFANYLFEFDNGGPDDCFLESRKHMEIAAEGGNVIAQWNMAEGGGLTEALKWYAALAEGGDVLAKYKLALRYLYWIGDAEGVALGLSICREAAYEGSLAAQTELAEFFPNGRLAKQARKL